MKSTVELDSALRLSVAGGGGNRQSVQLRPQDARELAIKLIVTAETNIHNKAAGRNARRSHRDDER